MTPLGPPFTVHIFAGTLAEFAAECEARGLDPASLLAREFHGVTYVGGDAIRDWPRARPVAPGPHAAEWLAPSPAPKEAAR